MQQKLKDYTEDKIHYTPIMNIMMNNRSKDWYAELGKYITETLDIICFLLCKCGWNFHIGYDYRGTGIEIELPNNYQWGEGSSDLDAKKCFDSLKKIVDLYKEKN